MMSYSFNQTYNEFLLNKIEEIIGGGGDLEDKRIELFGILDQVTTNKKSENEAAVTKQKIIEKLMVKITALNELEIASELTLSLVYNAIALGPTDLAGVFTRLGEFQEIAELQQIVEMLGELTNSGYITMGVKYQVAKTYTIEGQAHYLYSGSSQFFTKSLVDQLLLGKGLDPLVPFGLAISQLRDDEDEANLVIQEGELLHDIEQNGFCRVNGDWKFLDPDHSPHIIVCAVYDTEQIVKTGAAKRGLLLSSKVEPLILPSSEYELEIMDMLTDYRSAANEQKPDIMESIADCINDIDLPIVHVDGWSKIFKEQGIEYKTHFFSIDSYMSTDKWLAMSSVGGKVGISDLWPCKIKAEEQALSRLCHQYDKSLYYAWVTRYDPYTIWPRISQVMMIMWVARTMCGRFYRLTVQTVSSFHIVAPDFRLACHDGFLTVDTPLLHCHQKMSGIAILQAVGFHLCSHMHALAFLMTQIDLGAVPLVGEVGLPQFKHYRRALPRSEADNWSILRRTALLRTTPFLPTECPYLWYPQIVEDEEMAS